MLNLTDLHQYQRDIANHILKNNGSFVVAEMGLGKTAPTVSAINYLQKEQRFGPALVLAPLRVIYNSWPNELQKWEHLKNMRSYILHGQGKDIGNLSYHLKNQNIILSNFETLPFIEKKNIHKYCDILVIDESSLVKNSKTKRFKILKRIAGGFKKKILLTGTPAPSGELWELFAQIMLLDGGQRLGTSFWQFQNTFYNKADFMGYKYELKPDSRAVITNKVKDITIALKARDYLKLPPVIHNTIYVSLPTKTASLYKEMEKEFLIELENNVVTAANAAVKSAKLRQITAGGIYHEGGQEYTLLHEEKINTLAEIIEGTDSNVLCCYQFKFERSLLERRIPRAKFIDGSTSAVESTKIIKDWNAGKVKILCCHPQSVGHGLNLQSGGHILVWLSPDWSLERTQQMNARLYRQGQTQKVFIHQIIATGTIDEVVVESLKQKKTGQASLIKALKKYSSQKRSLT